jgi:CDGSH-type Zn-finger protein/truncated hemoglobin YjbI
VRDQVRDLLARARDLERGAEAAGDDDGIAAAGRRLRRSVVRPLADAVGGAAGRGGSRRDRKATALSPADLDAALWKLTRDATRVRARAGGPPGLLEAVAALQDLALRDEESVAERRAELEKIQRRLPTGIQASSNGPYLVTNAGAFNNWLGEPLAAQPQMALCRCGESAMKPFCDGSHAEVGFTDEKDPKRVPDHRDEYAGLGVTVLDNRGICQHSGFCTDRVPTVFHSGEEPFVTASGGRMDEIVRAARDCPSGALSYAIDEVEARDEVDHHGRREPAIEVSKDGPYRIVGGIPLADGEGRDEPRADGASREHYALCRCGHSQNKPFCSGMHWYVEFKDPVPEPDHEPTIFEWAGGLPALTRMTRIFYERYVPEDPLLAPLFANMSPDHPERVAKWLGEVFCGPKAYSEQYGGYSRMISQHLGKALTEEMRARWVRLIKRAADDARLPADPEFRSVFSAYIDWGSRLALENSQADARPPEHMPMPHWDWNTAAGPPGSRVSALAPEDEEPEAVLPSADERVTFDKHVKTLFRERDRQSMKLAFDLWAYDDVKANAPAILERVKKGSMPCDGAWPKAKVDVFRRWVDTGMSE